MKFEIQFYEEQKKDEITIFFKNIESTVYLI